MIRSDRCDVRTSSARSERRAVCLVLQRRTFLEMCLYISIRPRRRKVRFCTFIMCQERSPSREKEGTLVAFNFVTMIGRTRITERDAPNPRTHTRTVPFRFRDLANETHERPRDERFSEWRMHFEAFVLLRASVTAEGHRVEGPPSKMAPYSYLILLKK